METSSIQKSERIKEDKERKINRREKESISEEEFSWINEKANNNFWF